MKYNIFDYNQKKAIELGLDLKDLLILNWIQTFYPKMNKTIRNNKQYVWIKYYAVLQDIPILEIESEKGLYKRMQKMCEIGILEYLPIRTSQGCFAYYLITELMAGLVSSHSSESSTGSSESSTGSSESSDAIIYSSTINNPSINSKKEPTSGFSSQSNRQENLDSSVSAKNSHTQKQKDEELKTKQEVQEFVINFKAKEVIVDGILQTAPIFSQNEIDLITEYILRRKEAYKSKVKNTQKALTGVLNDILQVMKEIPLEIIFKQLEGVYVNCGTKGDKSKPYQTIELSYFQHLKQKPTFNNQNANTKTLRDALNQNREAIRNFNPDNCF